MSRRVRKLLAGTYYTMVCCFAFKALTRKGSICFSRSPECAEKNCKKNLQWILTWKMHIPSQYLILLLRDMSKRHKYLLMNIIYSAPGKCHYLYLNGDYHFIQAKCHCSCILFQVNIYFLLLFCQETDVNVVYLISTGAGLYTTALQPIKAPNEQIWQTKT